MTGADARRDEIGLRLFVAETRLIPDLAAHFLDDAVTGDGVTARRTDREDGLTECFEGLLPGDRGQLGGGARPRQRGEQFAPDGGAFAEDQERRRAIVSMMPVRTWRPVISMPNPMARLMAMAGIQINRPPTDKSLPRCPFRRKGSRISGKLCLEGGSPETPGALTIVSSGTTGNGRPIAGS